jgi:hypothetical protein
MSDPHAFPPEETAGALPAGGAELPLLRIVCAVAWCDGEFSDGEQRLLNDLVARYLSPVDGEAPSAQVVERIASRSASLELLDTLPQLLPSPEDRQLAVKLAYMMVRVSRGPGDTADINPREKQAYRRLVEAAGLEPGEVEATEWAAESELKQLSGGVLGLFRRAFAGLGPWPEASLLQQPGAPRL